MAATPEMHAPKRRPIALRQLYWERGVFASVPPRAKNALPSKQSKVCRHRQSSPPQMNLSDYCHRKLAGVEACTRRSVLRR